MDRAADIYVEAHELAASVDPIGIGAYGTRDVDRGEGPFVQQKAVLRAADIAVPARDLAMVIDPEGPGREHWLRRQRFAWLPGDRWC